MIEKTLLEELFGSKKQFDKESMSTEFIEQNLKLFTGIMTTLISMPQPLLDACIESMEIISKTDAHLKGNRFFPLAKDIAEAVKRNHEMFGTKEDILSKITAIRVAEGCHYINDKGDTVKVVSIQEEEICYKDKSGSMKVLPTKKFCEMLGEGDYKPDEEDSND